MSDSPVDQLLPALLTARRAISAPGKSGRNQFDKYDYATELDWHAAIMPPLLANGLVLQFSVDDIESLPDRTTKNGGIEHAVRVKVRSVLHHAPSGQALNSVSFGEGQDRADKAVYKAITGAKKYAYATLFALPTTDDPERDEAVGESHGPIQTPAAAPSPTESPASKLTMMISGIKTWADSVGIEEAIHKAKVTGKSKTAVMSLLAAKREQLVLDVGEKLAEAKEAGKLKMLRAEVERVWWPDQESKDRCLSYLDGCDKAAGEGE